jgi:predicted RNA-binding Zn-ribbon protein involved in translation (DUF1610 family)
MATIIKVTCPICGDQQIGPPDIYVTLDPNYPTYTFSCPRCEEAIERHADGEVIELLRAANVAMRTLLTEDSIDTFSAWLSTTTLTARHFNL